MNPDIRVGGSWRPIIRGELYKGSSWRALTRGEIYKSGAWHALFAFTGPLSVSISPDIVEGVLNPPTHATWPVNAGPVTATPSGGLGPYTYLYEVVSHTGAMPTFSNATNATTTITKSTPANATLTDQFRVTVTDSLGATAVANFSASFTNEPATGGI